MLKDAILYANYGWFVFPLSPNSKIPFPGSSGYKDARKDEDKVTALFKPFPDCNIGVATGEWSGIFVVDVDNKDNGRGSASLEALQRKYGKLPETVQAFTPTGGIHLYFKHPLNVAIGNSASQVEDCIDIRGDGGYVVLPPSTIDGKSYEWECTHSPFEFPIADAPQWLLGLCQKTKRDFEINLSEKDRIIDKGNRNDRLFEIAVVARGSGLVDQATLFTYLQGVNLHSCKPPVPEREIMTIVNSVLSYDDRKTENPKDPDDILIWDKSKEGKYKSTYRNALNFLKSEPRLHSLFKYNEFSHQIDIIEKPYWIQKWHGKKTLDDNDINQIKQLLTTLNYEPARGVLIEAIDTYAYSSKYHPVMNYLNSLKWDGVSRIDTFLSTYLGAENTHYTRFTSQMLLCSCCARVYYPGCKYDYMIILEGEQGIGKSLALQALGGEWFCEALLTERDKDTIDKIQGQWIIEVPELEVFKKKEVESLKSFLSTQVDRVRLAYAHKTQSFPRQNVFIGTINPDGLGYLRDTTGNRRFFPVTCGKIDIQRIKEDRDQLFAEAFLRVKNGTAQLYPDKSMDITAQLEQEARVTFDEWQNFIEAWLSDPIKCRDRNILDGKDVWCHGLNGEIDNLSRANQMRMANVLRQMGYRTKVVSSGGRNIRKWVKEGFKASFGVAMPLIEQGSEQQDKIDWQS